MLRRALAISGIAILGLTVSATRSFAADATATIDFSATVPATCFFGTATGTGTLSLQADSVSDLGTATQTIPLTCNGGATLSASNVTQTGVTELATKTVALTVNNDPFTSGDAIDQSTFDATTGMATIGVQLTASNTAPIKAGAYTFSTTLTAAPN